jgi:hypothetical protein
MLGPGMRLCQPSLAAAGRLRRLKVESSAKAGGWVLVVLINSPFTVDSEHGPCEIRDKRCFVIFHKAGSREE